ncbi:hypothetical protein KKA50_02525 [Patescibacteria group bacterium]|nr:hypothetical protein [Patescibacteria group bacterium]
MAEGLIFFLGFCILIILPFTVLIISLIVRGRKRQWKGTVMNKLGKTSNSNKTDEDFLIIVETDNGKEIKITVDKSRYDNWKVGDRLEKVKEENWPQKISAGS